ncbi:hypothetical protein BG015_006782 [Linnemannia schmuckeri]|uniref:Uncharacterized protein n=1 Tax=Linnemannia schmuckeri TaxID=64567 RepID=A0A9P5VET3_9FUNG|nr:hypothetical protein BG015_006782 [Linnemannia schmuckeri]
MKITFGYIALLVCAHQLILLTISTIPLTSASPIPKPIDPIQAAAEAAAAAGAAEAARQAKQMLEGGFSGGGGKPSDTPISTPGPGSPNPPPESSYTPDPVKTPPPPPAAGGASRNSLRMGGNWATNKMKKRLGLSGDDYISSHSLSMQTLEDTSGNNAPLVNSVSLPSSLGRSPLLERRGGLYERRGSGELKEEVVSPKFPEVV